jgi:protein-tyrosine phosphatase
MKKTSVLFVCMGNICRSPTAHGVMRHKVHTQGLADAIRVDSAGTHNYHPGRPPDERSQAHARRRGYELSDLRARQIRDTDFTGHDLILVMDWENLENVQAIAPCDLQHKVKRLTEFAIKMKSPVVPDPYNGTPADFERVLDLVEDACDGLLLHIRTLSPL